MKASFIRKTLTVALAVLLFALSLASCKATLKPGENGLYDKQSKVTYSHASTVYEATKLVKEYGKLALTKEESYALYTVPGSDPTEILATEDFNIVYASDIDMPTLLEMAPYQVDICVDATTIHTVAKITDVTEIASLVAAFSANDPVTYPGTTPLRNYRVRFESDLYPGFYYTLTYVEYGSDLVIEDENYGKYFLYSAFDQLFVPVGDEIHRAWVFRTVGYGNGETYWRDMVSNLRLVGYDRVLSIEHEDSLMSIDEGLAKAVAFLKDICIYEPKPGTMSWA